MQKTTLDGAAARKWVAGEGRETAAEGQAVIHTAGLHNISATVIVNSSL